MLFNAYRDKNKRWRETKPLKKKTHFMLTLDNTFCDLKPVFCLQYKASFVIAGVLRFFKVSPKAFIISMLFEIVIYPL